MEFGYMYEAVSASDPPVGRNVKTPPAENLFAAE